MVKGGVDQGSTQEICGVGQGSTPREGGKQRAGEEIRKAGPFIDSYFSPRAGGASRLPAVEGTEIELVT